MELISSIIIFIWNITIAIFSNIYFLIALIILNVLLRKYYPQLRGLIGELWVKKN